MHKAHLFRILDSDYSEKGLLAFSVKREINVSRRIGDGEWEDVLIEMLRSGFITITADTVFGDRRLKLTAAGKEEAKNF